MKVSRVFWPAIWAGLLGSVLIGCGGGGGGGGSASASPVPASEYTPMAYGRLRVNVDSGVAEIMPVSSDGRVSASGAAMRVQSFGARLDGGERPTYMLVLQLSPTSYYGVADEGRIVLDNVKAGTVDPGDERGHYVVQTFAGSPDVPGLVDGPRGVGRISSPIAVDLISDGGSGDDLVVASASRVWRISPQGAVSTLYSSAATINDVCAAGDDVLVAVSDHTIVKVNLQTKSTNVIGVAGTSGNVGGSGSTARLNNPTIVQPTFFVDANGFRSLTPSSNTAGTVQFTYTSPRDLKPVPNASSSWLTGHIGTKTISNSPGIYQLGALKVLLSSGTTGSQNGPAPSARFNTPEGFDVDSKVVVLSDSGSNNIRAIRPLGNGTHGTSAGYYATTIAGTGVAGFQDGPAELAKFDNPKDVAYDSFSGDIYVADRDNHVIRRIMRLASIPTDLETEGSLSTEPPGFLTGFLLPRPGSSRPVPAFQAESGAGMVAAQLYFTLPEGANTLEADVTFETHSGFPSAIHGVIDTSSPFLGSSDNLVRTIAGRSGLGGYADGNGVGAAFSGPTGIAVDGEGRYFVADRTNGLIRFIDKNNVVTTIIGDPFNSSTVPVNGTGLSEAGSPFDLAVAADGKTLWWTDSANHVVRKATFTGAGSDPLTSKNLWSVTTILGLAGTAGDATGLLATSRFNAPRGIALDPAGNMVYVADTGNHRIKRFSALGTANLQAFFGTGSPSAAGLSSPNDVAVGPTGDVFVTDTGNFVIRKIDPARTGAVLAGTVGSQAYLDSATPALVRFTNPQSLVVDKTGYVYLTDALANSTMIRRVSPSGETKSCVGNSAATLDADGPGDVAVLANVGPGGLALTNNNELVMAQGNLIREVHRRVTQPLGE